jgi:predicted dehydrogenase
MSSTLNIGVIGLGVMGQRMLDRLAAHPRLRATQVWDANPQALAHTVGARPGLQAAEGPQQLMGAAGLHCVYIATPPGPHMALSNAAFDAGLAVFCEKPLTVDFDAARQTIARIEREGHRAAVNFSLASSPGLATLQANFGAGSGAPLGPLQEVDIELEFAAWPRPWQAGAGRWLAERAEGGFAREVLSHFVFVLQRVLGPATVQSSEVDYPADGRSAETALTATLRAGGVAVHVRARVDADVDVPDRNRMRWRARDGEIELREWFGLSQQRQGEGWKAQGTAEVLRTQGQADQLDQWVNLIERRPQGLPGYREALAVQQTIEALL